VSSRTRRETQGGTDVREKVEPPKRYKVLLLNDDYTSMEFVVHVLVSVFRHGPAAATRIMLSIHRTGVGTAGVFSKEVGETKLEAVHALAREAGYPLMGTLEPE
jgi:ATP-dependent Clp protease adaptor protein ClpS